MRCDHRSRSLWPYAAREIAVSRGALLFASTIFILLSLSGCSLFEEESTRGKAAAPGTAVAAAAKPKNTAMDAFRAIAKPEGLKFTPLFSEPIGNTDDRVRRLEETVQTLRNDLDTVVPSMVRLVAIEKDMKELVSQLQSLTTGVPMPAAAVVDAEGQVIAEPAPIPLTEIPGEDVAGGTEPVQAATKTAETGEATSQSSSVTPEAASKGKMPPEGAASPNSQQPPVTPNARTVVERPAAPLEAERLETAAPAEAVPESASEAEPVPAVPAAPKAADVSWNNVGGMKQKAVKDTPRPPQVVGGVEDVRIGDHKDKTRIVLDLSTNIQPNVTLQNEDKQLVIDLPGLLWEGPHTFIADGGILVSGWHYEAGKLYIDMIAPVTIKKQQMLPPSETIFGDTVSKAYRLSLDVFSPEVHK